MKKPVPGIHHAAICTADVERSMKFWRDGLGFTELFDQTFTGDWPELFGAKNNRLRSIFLGAPPARPRHGFFLLSPQREVETTLCTLAALGFGDGLHRITMPAPGGAEVAMAVITAPDGVLVELIGPAR